ncbi:hypothetical protein LCGC14_2474090, partial [marine sediment metagenome]
MVISIAVAMGLIISPESLIILGNGIGNAGVYFILSIAIAVIFYMPNVIGQSVATLAGGEIRLMKATLGPIASGASSLCSRVAFTICALPVLLSTAGFVLNETFVSWFPPFLFAHLLLIVLAALNIAHRKAAEVVQAVLVSLVLSGLLVLSVTGITSSSITGSGGETLALTPGIASNFGAMATAVLLFVGFDLMFLSARRKPDDARHAINAMMLAAIVFTLWALASFFNVPLDKLQASTIPYSRAARAIMGAEGRIVIGVVIIAGAASAVNVLLMGVGRMMTELASEGLLPRAFQLGEGRDAASIVFLAGLPAAFMLLGYAGEPRLLVYVKGALLLWLLHYALMHLSVILALKEKRGGLIYMMSLMGVLVFSASLVVLVYVSEG